MNRSVKLKFLTERELVVRTLMAARLHPLAVRRGDAQAIARCEQARQAGLAEIDLRNAKKINLTPLPRVPEAGFAHGQGITFAELDRLDHLAEHDG